MSRGVQEVWVEWLMKRSVWRRMPLLLYLIPFLLGCLLWRLRQVNFEWLVDQEKVCVGGGLFLIISLWSLKSYWWRFWRVLSIRTELCFLFILLGLSGFFYVNYQWQRTDYDQFFFDDINPTVLVEGQIVDYEDIEKEDWLVRVQRIKIMSTGQVIIPQKVKILARKPLGQDELNPGDFVAISGVMQEFQQGRNPGEFDYRRFQRYNGILAELREGKVKLLKRPGFNLKRFMFLWTEQAYIFFSNHLSGRSWPIVMALLTGRDEYLSKECLETIRTLGLSHLLAISGLHLGLLVTMLKKLLIVCQIPRKLHPIIILPALWLAVIFVGAEPSSMRVGVFLSLTQLGEVLNRPPGRINLLAATAWLILLQNPLTLFQLSFQLSFLVYLAILLMYQPMNDFLKSFFPTHRLLQKVQNSLALSLTAFLGSLPVILFHFYQVSVQGIWMNLWAVPLIGLTLITTLIALTVGGWLPGGELILLGLDRLSELFINLIQFFGQRLSQVWRPGRWNVLLITVFYFGLWLIWRLRSLRVLPKPWYKREQQMVFRYIILIGLILSGVQFIPQTQLLEWTVLDVGQGDGMVLELPGEFVMLIDGGGRPGVSNQTGERIIIPFLMSRGITKIDLVCITHFDADHVQGLLPILRDFPIKMIWAPAGSQSEYARLVESIARSRRIPLYNPYQGQILNLPKTQIRILHPVRGQAYKSENQLSLAFLLTYAGRHILFTGDLGSVEERELVDNKQNVQADILKVGHHGSKNSSSSAFLEDVQPKLAIISVGLNRYGHPSEEVLNRLNESYCSILRTDQFGAIQIVIRDKGIKIKTFCSESVD